MKPPVHTASPLTSEILNTFKKLNDVWGTAEALKIFS